MSKKQKHLLVLVSAFALAFGVMPTANAMHIMEGYLPGGFCIAWGILCVPFLVAGFGIKILFFTLKGFGREYIAGIKNGFQISKKNHKIPFKFQNLSNYFRIQVELWVNIFRRLCG